MSDNQATPMNPNSPTPLYLQIKEYCQDSITSGDYPEHTRLPSERRLAERFQVSRMTVTKALKGLEQEGWLYTRMGKGTFVASRTKIDQKLESLTSFTEDMKTQHRQVTSQVLYAGVEACAGEVAAELRLATGTPVFVLERLRLADGEIIALERTHIPNLLCPGIEQAHDFSKESLYGVLRGKYALQLTEAQQTVEARRPAPDEMDKLHTGPATPVLGFTRTTFTPQGQPIEFVCSVYLGNRYKLRISLKPMSSNMQHQGAWTGNVEVGFRRLRLGQKQDTGGKLALSGNADQRILEALLEHPYFLMEAPKSLDRNQFELTPVLRLSPADGAATLSAFTAEAVTRSVELLPEPPLLWLVTGGGRHNQALMRELSRRLGTEVKPVAESGWQGDALEAQAFGYLAVRSVMGLPLSLPSTTGVPLPLSGGVLHGGSEI